MAVIHVLKDGTVKEDITGTVIRYEDAESLYELIQRINEKRG